MPIAVLHKKIDSLPEPYVEKVGEYVEFLLWNLNTNGKENVDISTDKKAEALAKLDKILSKRKPMRPDFDMDKELETALRERNGIAS